jgi:hypothetical protein
VLNGEDDMNYKLLIGAVLIATLANKVLATDSNFTVDQADGPNQLKFFQDTKNQKAFIKEDFKEPWDPTDTKAVNAFETEKGGAKTYTDKNGNANTVKADSQVTAVVAKPGEKFEKGQRINIREQYSLTGKPSANDATNALQGQMASFCPNGFAKHGEWVKPVEGTKDFYMYYQFECIE